MVKMSRNMFYTPGGCTAHGIVRIGQLVFREDELTGKVYNMEFVCNVTQYHNRLLSTAWDMIDEELVIIDGSELPVDGRMEEYRQDVLRHTYSRGFVFVRARLNEDDGKGEAARAESRLRIGSERTITKIITNKLF